MLLFCIEWAQSFDDCGHGGPPDLPMRHTSGGIRRFWSGRRMRTLTPPPVVPLAAAASCSNKSDAQHSGRLPELPMTSLHARSGVTTGVHSPAAEAGAQDRAGETETIGVA